MRTPDYKYAPVKIAAAYLGFAAFYILVSDYFLTGASFDPPTIPLIHTTKGLFFVLVTAALLYIVLRNHFSALTRSEETLRQHVADLTAVNRLSGQVTGSLSLEQVTTSIQEHCHRMLQPDIILLFLGSGGRLTLERLWTEEPGLRPMESEEAESGRCLCGIAYETGTPMYIKDIHSDTRCTMDACKQTGIRSFAALPLRGPGDMLGVIGIGSLEERDFSTRSTYLETLANHAAIGLQNALLYTRVHEYAAGLEKEIHRHRETGEQLRENRERLNLALEGSRDGLYDWNVETGEVLYDHRWIEMMGYEPHEVAAHVDFWESLLHPEEKDRILETLKKHVEGLTGTYRSEHRLHTKSGSWKWVWDRGRVVARTADGKPCRMIGTVTDISDMKHAEIRIERLNTVLRALRNISQLITREKDRNRLVLSACEILTLTRGYFRAWIVLFESDGKRVLAAESGAGDPGTEGKRRLDVEDLMPCVAQALAIPEVVVVDGAGPVLSNCPLYSLFAGMGFMSRRLDYDDTSYGVLVVSMPPEFATDPDERELFSELAGDLAFALHNLKQNERRMQMEEERRQLEAQLVQSQKMEAIGTLAGGIAHDFNNILSGIIGYTELCLQDLPEDSPARGTLCEVRKAGNRARDLVRRILMFSRQKDHERRPVSMTLVVREAVDFLRASLPSTIRIQERLEVQEDTVSADLVQIHQVLMNLAANAAHAMDGKGLLEITLTPVILRPREPDSHSDLRPGSYVQLSVRDTGHGIPSDIRTKIFEPFFTTKKTGEGTGLGLSLVYGIVRSHGGDIRVESPQGSGATFRILLPVLPQEAVEEKEFTRPPMGNGERILFVDDEETLAEWGEQALQAMGYRVVATTSSGEALALFRESPADFQLVITDKTMPELTGIELARELLRIRPDIPVILFTGFTDEEGINEALNIGIRQVVLKPVILYELAESIRNALAPAESRADSLRSSGPLPEQTGLERG